MATINKDSIDFDFLGVGNLILNNNLQVPVYQRSFSWEEKQVEDLFQDIQKAVLIEGSDVYFIGTIVTTIKDGILDVIDGQQRIATITMLLAAIRDYFFAKGDTERVEQLTGRYLRSKDLKTLELIPKLRLNENDNVFFCDCILRDPNEEERQKAEAAFSSNQKVQKAFQILQKQLEILLTSYDEDDLFSIIEFIHDKLTIVHISVSDDSNAFTIFETLNDRGLSLAISDLLKNYLFGLAKERLYEVQASWTAMFSLLESQDDKKLIIEFLRHYFSAKYHLVREKDLYQAIKSKVKTKGQAALFAKDLNENATRYLAVLQNDSEFWRSHSTATRNSIQFLNRLGFVQVRPLLLSVVAKFSKANVTKATSLILSLTVRLLIRGTSGSGAIEESYCRAAQKLYRSEIINPAQLKTELKSIIPTNAAFKSAFENATVSKSYIARYYLLTIENYFRKEDESELFPSSDEDKLNLEHILPQKPGDAWDDFSEEDQKLYYRRIGNLTLLATKTNSALKSAKYSHKKRILEKSKLKINQDFHDIGEWSIEAISQRQRRLAQIAVKAWKI